MGRSTVVAIRIGEKGLLAVHRSLTFRREWVIAHVPTTLGVAAHFQSKAAACRCADVIAQLANWDFECEPEGGAKRLLPEQLERIATVVNLSGGYMKQAMPTRAQFIAAV
jgi:hypothetical protein